MKLRVLGAFGSEGLSGRPSAFLVNDRLLVDAGTVTGALTLPEQLAVRNVLVSHAHLDHVAGLAFLTDTLACRHEAQPVTVVGTEPIVHALRTALFNNVVWPDFTRLPPGGPVVRFRTLEEDADHSVGDLWITPIAVDHSVPAVGFLVHDGTHGFVYSGDTGPTDALWKAARTVPGLRAIILECSFPNRLAGLAGASGHMTPALVQRELPKLPPDVPVRIFHVKPPFFDEVIEELDRIDGPVTPLEQDATYEL